MAAMTNSFRSKKIEPSALEATARSFYHLARTRTAREWRNWQTRWT